MQTLPAALPDPGALDAAADPAHFVIVSCERAKAWLAQCLEGGHIEQIVETKAQAEAIRVYTMQKQLGKDAELAASEIVRRAERCIGLAIRRGQEEGRIAKRGDVGATLGRTKRDLAARNITLPSDIVTSSSREANDTYAMTDGVTDADFDAALEEAKSEGNLSRANVVRKVKKAPSAENVWSRLEDLIAGGHSSHQIASELGVPRDRLMREVKARSLTITADTIVGKSRRLNSDRMLREFANTLDSLVPSCELIDVARVDASVRAECIRVMDEAMRAFSRFMRRLRKEGEQ